MLSRDKSADVPGKYMLSVFPTTQLLSHNLRMMTVSEPLRMPRRAQLPEVFRSEQVVPCFL